LKKFNKRTNWDLIITPEKGWINLDLKSIWQYRDLIGLFARRNITAEYKQTVLGPLYFVIVPIIHTLINMFIFGKIAKLSTDGIPQFLFYMSGTLFWSYFSVCLSAGKSVFQSNISLFSQVYFPRLTVPIAQNISAMLRLLIQFMIFFIFYAFYSFQGIELNLSTFIFLIPLLFFQCSLLGLGTGILLSSFTTKYKDLNFIYTFLISIWMYLSPVVYPLSIIPDRFKYIASFNPMVGIIETGREILFGTSSFNSIYILNGLIVTFILLFFGLIIFTRVEKTFIDTV
tara:strand:+ start:3034 stop:3891 length:858 start_codon:yes stop_codon:yes gene_type:complete